MLNYLEDFDRQWFLGVTLRLCQTMVLLILFSVSASSQSPTPTPISKPDPPTVQTPSTVGRIIKWTGSTKNGFGIVGDSVITESGGNIGINTTNPLDKLSVGGAIDTTTQYNIGGSRVLSADATKLNLFAGFSSGSNNTTGDRNSFFGTLAGFANTTGNGNSFFGVLAGRTNTTGFGNSFFGLQAGWSNSTGSSNSFFGNAAGSQTTTGNGNVFFGTSAGLNNTTGANNAVFGFNAGQSNTTESNNTFIGANSNGTAGITNATAVGANAVVTQSNTIVLGNNADVVMSRDGTVGRNLLVSGTLVGNGSGLTNLKPANIASGTADIDITGNAATASTANVANALASSTVVPISNGGTGSATQNFVDLSTNQTVNGSKVFAAGIHVVISEGTAGQFDGNVTINGNLNVSGSTNIAPDVIHDSTLTGNGTSSSPLSVQNGVFTTGSYANPSWITSLDGNKITGGSVVKSLNGLSDNVTLAAGANVSLNNSGSTLTISANSSRRVALGQWWTTVPRDDINLSTTQLTCCNIQLVASDGADLWVPDGSSSVFRVRASDGKVLEQWSAPDGVGVLSAIGRIFVTSQSTNRLYMIDPTQPVGSATMVADSLGTVPTGITFDGSKIWTTNFSGSSVSIVTPSAGTSWNVQTVSGFVNPYGILYDGNNIWVTDFGDSKLKKLDSNGNVVQSVAVGIQPIFAVFDGKNIWVPNRGSNSLSVVRAVDGVVVATLTGNGMDGPQSAAFDGERILVTNLFGDKVSLWKAADFTPIGFCSTGAGSKPLSACSDGLNFWITLTGSGKLLRF